MIVICPSCSARYRVDAQRLGAVGMRVRCGACQARFRVDAAEESAQGGRGVSPAAVEAPPERPLRALVVDPDTDRAKRTADYLTCWDARPALARDGVEAILAVQRTQPALVVAHATLERMDGLELCELIKRNESLRRIRVALVTTPGQAPDWAAETEGFGPDERLEPEDLPDGLAPLLRQLGLAPGEASSDGSAGVEAGEDGSWDVARAAFEPGEDTGWDASSAPLEPCSDPLEPALADASPRVAPAAPPDPALDAKRADAERLARIVVSDVILYRPDKFEQAVREGNVLEAIEPDMAEGRALFARRVDARVRAERDFLTEELLRVARERGMK